MKTKKLTLLLCTLCFFLAVFTLPAAAKSKSIPKKLFLSRKEILLYVGESKNLWVEKVRPAKASPKVTWKSKKPKIASVSRNGKVTAKKPGKTIITAVSRQNPSVKSALRIIVKKRPKKQEKTCSLTGKFYQDDYSAIKFFCQCADNNFCIILRSREDIQELISLLKKDGLKNYDFNKCFLAEYKNMNFTKESLVLFFSEALPLQIISANTQFDALGKLQCTVKVQLKHDKSNDYPKVTWYRPDSVTALRINRQDEAMIDYFHFEGETVK